jgi:3',5'-cyclic AMP phosphodiesterase CpdA
MTGLGDHGRTMRARSLVFLAVMAGCSSSSTETAELPAAPSRVVTTVEQRLEPKQAKEPKLTALNPALVESLPSFAADYGDVVVGAGEAHTGRTLDGSAVPNPGANPKRLVRFAHLADLQLSDDESPTRLGSFDNPVTDAALRPQDANICRMVNAAVRTINSLHAEDPLSFVLLGGDNADSAQTNEVDWVMSILNGADRVECDSGNDDDPVPGPDNDGKDPFRAEGLKMPWKWVTGNHDILVQGNLPVGPKMPVALGTIASGGTRDWSRGGTVDKGDFVVADPRRALLDRPALMGKIASDGKDHGVGAEQKASGKAYHFFDVEGTSLRFLVLDTGAETGGADGVIHQADVDAFVKPALDDAKAKGKQVILASHHSVESLTTNGGAFGVEQADALTIDAWKSFIGQYDNVVFSMVAHTHKHRVRAIQPDGGHAWWEIMTSAIADFPHEFRIVEVWDQDNGWLMLRATCVDLDVEGDKVAAEGRRLGVIDFRSAWLPGDGRGEQADRNVELHIKKPGG